MPSFAFRCNTCGQLVEAEAAGERSLPAACPQCGHGVRFDPLTGIKSYVDENWEVLADADDDRIAELEAYGLTPDQVVAHEPFATPGPDREPQLIEVGAQESIGAGDVSDEETTR